MSPTTLSDKRPIRFRFKALSKEARSDNSQEDFQNLKQTLQQALKVAIALEFSTIPPYLTALYSLKDKSSDAYRVIRSVALEEMLHINLACNLLNAIAEEGNEKTRPQFYGKLCIEKLVPETAKEKEIKLPIAYPDTLLRPIFNGPRVQLMAASTDLMSQTFMAIEQPEPIDQKEKLEKGQEFDTIGQFYAAIEKLFDELGKLGNNKNNELFTGNKNWQRTDFYFGSGGGEPIKVTDIETAKKAIQQIMVQGEGATPPTTTSYIPKQEYGTYNHYGMRTDGTYGPIVGTPYELSHYFKFKAIADGVIPLPSVYPMLPNPSLDKFKLDGDHNPDAHYLSQIFSMCYSLLVEALEKIFQSSTSDTDDYYFTIVVALMQNAFPLLATQLMQTPVLKEGDATLGPTAGPCFEENWCECSECTSLDGIKKLVFCINVQINQFLPEMSSRARETLEAVRATIEDINSKCAAKS
ncbi:ferritin-like protein [Okeania sp. SIO2B9]|uniref:ferritin-like domain-containing protein n=1 Tax=Okeania sp. SIO2B9 TaxID=2607782 RepID=UPI00142C3C78|nr:ferritin-like protein [Okeania sp. SIO2B9]NES90187.1 hypothetical protein [Okeania sp. SIO2B9]